MISSLGSPIKSEKISGEKNVWKALDLLSYEYNEAEYVKK